MSAEKFGNQEEGRKASYKIVLPAAIAAFLGGYALNNDGESVEKALAADSGRFAEALSPETVEKFQQIAKEIDEVSRSENLNRIHQTPIGTVTFSFAPDQSFVLSRKIGSSGTIDHVYKIDADSVAYSGGKNLDSLHGEPHAQFSVSYRVDGYEGNYKLQRAEIYDKADNSGENFDEDVGTDLLVINWINSQEDKD